MITARGEVEEPWWPGEDEKVALFRGGDGFVLGYKPETSDVELDDEQKSMELARLKAKSGRPFGFGATTHSTSYDRWFDVE